MNAPARTFADLIDQARRVPIEIEMTPSASADTHSSTCLAR